VESHESRILQAFIWGWHMGLARGGIRRRVIGRGHRHRSGRTGGCRTAAGGRPGGGGTKRPSLRGHGTRADSAFVTQAGYGSNPGQQGGNPGRPTSARPALAAQTCQSDEWSAEIPFCRRRFATNRVSLLRINYARCGADRSSGTRWRRPGRRSAGWTGGWWCGCSGCRARPSPAGSTPPARRDCARRPG